MTTSESLVTKTIAIGAVVSSYWIVSISMVFLNKYLLSSSDLKLDAPLFITWYQCVIAVVLCWLFGKLGTVYPESFFRNFPRFEYRWEIAKEVLPLSVVFLGMITFNNLCLKYVGVSFYNVGRSLTTVFNVALTYFVLNTKTSMKALLCTAVIVAGFFLGVDQEGDVGGLSFAGIFFGVCASLCVALNSIFVKRVLPLVDRNEWKLTLYNNLNACFLFIPGMIVLGELPVVISFPGLWDSYFWVMMTLGGIFGTSIAIVSAMQIKYTSPLTHNVSGTAKACAQTVLAVSYFEEQKTVLWWISNLMVLLGSLFYAHVRRLEMIQASQNAQTSKV